MARLNTQLESEAAEFFVLANLMLNKIPSYKNYTRHKDYDMIATNPSNNKLARIQVKSRYRLKASGFLINNFESDFVVFCKLNRSIKFGMKDEQPEYFIFPTMVIEKAITPRSKWGKVYLKDISNSDFYYNKWQLIQDFLTNQETC
jgi:hypothetical protein